jgi:lysophospholipase L1-like esterase
MNIICLGDSITHASAFAESDRWPTVLQTKLNFEKPNFYKVFNRGINGNTTIDGFERFPEEIIPLLPGLLIVEFGINDCNHREWNIIPRVGLEEYKNKQFEFHRICKKYNSQIVYIVNHPLHNSPIPQGNENDFYDNLQPYNQAVYEVATQVGAPTIDFPKIIENRKINLNEFLDEDGIHLTISGNHTYAQIVFERLLEIWE